MYYKTERPALFYSYTVSDGASSFGKALNVVNSFPSSTPSEAIHAMISARKNASGIRRLPAIRIHRSKCPFPVRPTRDCRNIFSNRRLFPDIDASWDGASIHFLDWHHSITAKTKDQDTGIYEHIAARTRKKNAASIFLLACNCCNGGG